jgi:AraC-like DNA-binding protein
VGALVTATAEALAREAERLEPAAVDAVLDNFCRLLAIAGGLARADAVAGGREALRAAALARVERYIEGHLAEPDLTPERVAGAVGLSLRRLHRVFEPTATSFARRVLERRLEACRAELASPAAAGRSVADVAFAWGFDNLVTFYRAFRRTYGCTPGEVRPVAQARAPLLSSPMPSGAASG